MLDGSSETKSNPVCVGGSRNQYGTVMRMLTSNERHIRRDSSQCAGVYIQVSSSARDYCHVLLLLSDQEQKADIEIKYLKCSVYIYA